MLLHADHALLPQGWARDVTVEIANGRIAAQGTPDQVRQSSDPLVHQFVTAAPDGPVRFHHPGPDVASDFGASAQSQPRGRA